MWNQIIDLSRSVQSAQTGGCSPVAQVEGHLLPDLFYRRGRGFNLGPLVCKEFHAVRYNLHTLTRLFPW